MNVLENVYENYVKGNLMVEPDGNDFETNGSKFLEMMELLMNFKLTNGITNVIQLVKEINLWEDLMSGNGDRRDNIDELIDGLSWVLELENVEVSLRKEILMEFKLTNGIEYSIEHLLKRD
jgi:hypothetical protein